MIKRRDKIPSDGIKCKSVGNSVLERVNYFFFIPQSNLKAESGFITALLEKQSGILTPAS